MKIVNPFNKAYRAAKKAKKQARAVAFYKAIITSDRLQTQTIHSTTSGIGNRAAHTITVSLTTFGKRINDVYLTIESIMQQSLAADQIILNIAADEFTPEALPATLKKQQARGLTIHFVERDLGPYTKYFYTLRDNPDSLIITVDDDQIYPVDMIDQLYRAYQHEPNIIHCLRAHKIRHNDQGELLPYRRWDWSTTDSTPSSLIFPTGIGGVLYFPGCFDEDVLNSEQFLALCPGADDVWLKAMSLKKGILCKKIADIRPFESQVLTIEGSQLLSLIRSNKSAVSGNDAKIKATFTHHDIYPLLENS